MLGCGRPESTCPEHVPVTCQQARVLELWRYLWTGYTRHAVLVTWYGDGTDCLNNITLQTLTQIKSSLAGGGTTLSLISQCQKSFNQQLLIIKYRYHLIFAMMILHCFSPAALLLRFPLFSYSQPDYSHCHRIFSWIIVWKPPTNTVVLKLFIIDKMWTLWGSSTFIFNQL